MERGWPVGESLGSEPALIQRYGASRAVVREAIRIVESHGVAEMRLGPSGGLTVAAPRPENVIDSFGLVLDHAEVTSANLLEASSALELMCVRLACERIDEAGIDRLRAVLELEEAEGPAPHSQRLHLAIAAETGNPALCLLVEVLHRLVERRGTDTAPSTRWTEDERSAHASIVAAIVAGDTPLAQHRLRRHLAANFAGGPETAISTI